MPKLFLSSGDILLQKSLKDSSHKLFSDFFKDLKDSLSTHSIETESLPDQKDARLEYFKKNLPNKSNSDIWINFDVMDDADKDVIVNSPEDQISKDIAKFLSSQFSYNHFISEYRTDFNNSSFTSLYGVRSIFVINISLLETDLVDLLLDLKEYFSKMVQDVFTGFQKPVSVANMYQNDNPAQAAVGEQNPKFEMVKKLYQLILGRLPSNSDLTYFVNINISEADLMKRMIESNEHVELVKSRQELLGARIQHNLMENELEKAKLNLNDKESIISNLNNLIGQKNENIEEQTKTIDSIEKKLNGSVKDPSVIKPKKKPMDSILDWFNKIFD